jgi:hypothetical protein
MKLDNKLIALQLAKKFSLDLAICTYLGQRESSEVIKFYSSFKIHFNIRPIPIYA